VSHTPNNRRGDDDIRVIDYLYDEMDQASRESFEAQMAHDVELRHQVETLQATRAACARISLDAPNADLLAVIEREARLQASRMTEQQQSTPWWNILSVLRRPVWVSLGALGAVAVLILYLRPSKSVNPSDMMEESEPQAAPQMQRESQIQSDSESSNAPTSTQVPEGAAKMAPPQKGSQGFLAERPRRARGGGAMRKDSKPAEGLASDDAVYGAPADLGDGRGESNSPAGPAALGAAASGKASAKPGAAQAPAAAEQSKEEMAHSKAKVSPGALQAARGARQQGKCELALTYYEQALIAQEVSGKRVIGELGKCRKTLSDKLESYPALREALAKE